MNVDSCNIEIAHTDRLASVARSPRAGHGSPLQRDPLPRQPTCSAKVAQGSANPQHMDHAGFLSSNRRASSAPLLGALADTERVGCSDSGDIEGPFSDSLTNRPIVKDNSLRRNVEEYGQRGRSGDDTAEVTTSGEGRQHVAGTSHAQASAAAGADVEISLRTDEPAILSDEARNWLVGRTVVPRRTEITRANDDRSVFSGQVSAHGTHHNTAHIVFASAVAQLLATGATFGVKPFVEAAVEHALIEAGWDDAASTDEVALSKLLSNVAGGLFVGIIHTAVGSSVADYANSKMGGVKFVDQTEGIGQRELNDFLATTLPVFLAFTASFSAGRALIAATTPQSSDDAWKSALARSLQSSAGGFAQGLLTALIKEKNSSKFTSERQNIQFQDMCKNVGTLLRKQFNYQNSTDFMKSTVGKISGGMLGMLASTYAGHEFGKALSEDLPESNAGFQAASGAVGMLAFLTLWFGCIHAGSLIGQTMDGTGSPSSRAATNVDDHV